MAAKASRSLCLALVLFEAARASQPGGPGAGGFPGGSYGYGGVPPQQQEQQQQQQQQRRDEVDGYTGASAQHHQHHQQQQPQQQQHHQQHQQAHQAAAAVATPASSSASPTNPHTPSALETPPATDIDGPPPLPAGWGELRTDDGRPYYVFYPTGVVQWERPKPPADLEGDRPEQAGATAATATGAAADGGGNEVAEVGEGAAGAEEEVVRGESEMSDAERELGARGIDEVNASGEIASNAYPGQISPMVNDEPPQQQQQQQQQQQPNAGAYQSTARSETPESRPASPVEAQVSDPFHQQQTGASSGGGGGGGDANLGSYPSAPWSDHNPMAAADGARDGAGGFSPPSPHQQPPAAARESQQPWSSEGAGPTAPGQQSGQGVDETRPPIWGMGGDRQATTPPPPQPTAEARQQPQPPIWGVSPGQQQSPPPADRAAPSQPWDQEQTAGGGGRDVAGGPHDQPGSSGPTAAAGGDGGWGAPRDPSQRADHARGLERGQGGGSSDKWLDGRQQYPDEEREGGRAAAGGGGGGGGGGDSGGAGGAGAPPPWVQQHGMPPDQQQQQQQRRVGPGGPYDRAAPAQGSRHQPTQAEPFGGGGDGGEPGRPSAPGQGQPPPQQQGSEQGRGGPQQWGSAPPPGTNNPGANRGPPGWRSKPQGGMQGEAGARGYGGSPEGWEWQGRHGAQERGQGQQGYYGRDGGYYQGTGPGAPAPQGNDEYGGFPAGSRALVPHGTASGGINDAKEQGLQLVKGAWARILVGTGKTRAVLHEAKEKAGVAASTASSKIKNTVGTVTSRVADVLEGDPQGLSGPYGQPPQDDYYRGPGAAGGDGRGQNDPRSWRAGPPSAYEGLSEAGPEPRGGPPGVHSNGGYPGYQGGGPGAPGGYGGGGGGRGGNAQRDPYTGGAALGGPGGYQGGAPPQGGQGGYPGPQRGISPPGSTYAPGGGGGSGPVGGQGDARGPPAEGMGMPYPGQEQQQQQQQQPPQRQPSQQQQPPQPQGQGQGQGVGGQWKKDTVADGGYWARF